MTIEQCTRIAIALARETARSDAAHLCGACVAVLDVSGAGITLMGGTNTGPVCCSNDRMRALEELQFTLGEGPCQDAFRTGQSVSVPDLSADDANWNGGTGPWGDPSDLHPTASTAPRSD